MEFMNQQTTRASVPPGVANVFPSQTDTNVAVWNQGQTVNPYPDSSWHPAWLDDDEARHEYMLACLEQDIAWQVHINRDRRGWTQTQLAKMVGTQQSAIARAEDYSYGRLSIGTLAKIAKAFRCALMLRFVSYEKFARDVADTSEASLFVPSFEN